MIDGSELKRVVEAALEPMASALWVRDWHIKTQYGPVGEGNVAECRRELPYLKGTLSFDPNYTADADDALDSLRHELLHLALAGYDGLCHAAQLLAGDGTPQRALLDASHKLACEQTVARLERMLDGMGYTSRVLAGLDPHPLQANAEPKPQLCQDEVAE